MKRFIVVLGLLLALSTGLLAGERLHLAPPPPTVRPSVSTWRAPFELLYRLYRDFFSRGDGATCRFYPTCSGFAMLAVRRHGPLIGGVMAADRLLRHHADTDHFYPTVRKGRMVRFYDPVERHTFWWHAPDTSPTAPWLPPEGAQP